MNLELQIFNNPEFGQIRVIEIDGEPWMVGKDVAVALGYSNPRDALSKHVDEEDKNTVANRDGIQGNPNMTIINESGLYSLVLSSKLPRAKRFRRWVTAEVLPSIRRTGTYSIRPQAEQTPQLIEALANCVNQLVKCVDGLSDRVAQLERVEAIPSAARTTRTIEPLPLSTSAQLLLRILMDLERSIPYAFGEVQISNQRLKQLLGIGSSHTLTAVRKELEAAGYIEFSSGVKGKPSIYQLKKQSGMV